MNSYSQTSGRWTLENGQVIGTGYSGNGIGLNNSQLQAIPNLGPIPQAEYTIGHAFTHPTKGPLVMNLIPVDLSKVFTRYGFLIHGDNSKHDESASEGCIVMPHDVREVISNLKDRQLKVVY